MRQTTTLVMLMRLSLSSRVHVEIGSEDDETALLQHRLPSMTTQNLVKQIHADPDVEPLCTKELERRSMYHVLHEPAPAVCEKSHDIGLLGIPTDAMLDRPIVEVMAEAPHKDGYCYYHQYTACSAAREAQDWDVSSKTYLSSLGLIMGKMQDVPYGFQDELVTSLPGVISDDAEFCEIAGWLSFNDTERSKVLSDFAYARDKGQQECEDPAVAARMQTVTKRDIDDLEASYAEAHKPGLAAQPIKEGGELPKPFLTQQNIITFKAFFCAMAGGTSCQMHFCASTFCKFPDGKIGAGCQCRSDFTLAEAPAGGLAQDVAKLKTAVETVAKVAVQQAVQAAVPH